MRIAIACAAMFAGVVVAANPVPKEPPAGPVTKEHLAAAEKNIGKIAIAILRCSDSDTNNGSMPTNIHDKNGKALLSWRVEILPYIEEEKLYKEFKLDEPWDSKHNKKLIAKMPKLYAPVRVKAKVGETFYQTFYGDDALFGPKKRPRFPASIIDGPSQTGLVFEAGEPVIWTKPADLPFDENKALPKLGGLFDGEFHVGLCDGSVILAKKDYDVDEMKKLIMPNDATPLDFDKLKK